MYIVVNDMVDEPLYMQIRSQIIAGIARGDLTAGDALPSVRRLASDLGINLHTVNKAYAVLRDEGYIVVRGRAGAFIAGAQGANSSNEAADSQMDDVLRDLARPGAPGAARLMNFSNVLQLKRNARMGQKAPRQKTLKRKTLG
ncbi:GntR family transcriptional regulator [Slackia sp.]